MAAREVFDFMKVEFESVNFLLLWVLFESDQKHFSPSKKHDEDRTRNRRRVNRKKNPVKRMFSCPYFQVDSIGLSPKQRFERKSEKRLEIYKKMYRKTLS